MGDIAHPLSVLALTTAGGVYVAFVAILFALSRSVPQPKGAGGGVENAGGRDFRLNGLRIVAIAAAVAAALHMTRLLPLSAVPRHFLALFVAANLFAFVVSLVLCFLGRQKRSVATEEMSSVSRFLREFYFGTIPDPRWLGVDLKMFSYRPSLIGLMLINLSFAVVQYETHGRVSDAMLLYQLFTAIYVLNYFQFESGMVFTWDVVAERFGWMLIWGDYVLVPFFYSLTGWFLVDRTEPLSGAWIAALIALFAFGFWLFRGANQQKHRFKRDPSARIWGRPAEALDGKLLVSGFWGIGRHLNYSGEICIYLAFTMTAGFDSGIPYLVPAWLAGLLIHRAWRDDRRCRAKYGILWKAYTRRAKFRMIPLLY